MRLVIPARESFGCTETKCAAQVDHFYARRQKLDRQACGYLDWRGQQDDPDSGLLGSGGGTRNRLRRRLADRFRPELGVLAVFQTVNGEMRMAEKQALQFHATVAAESGDADGGLGHD